MALDPYYDQTILYLPAEPFTGTPNNSSSLLAVNDYSKYRHYVSLIGTSISYNSTYKKYGTYGLYSPSALTAANISNLSATLLGAGDFTVEGWLYANTTQTIGSAGWDMGVLSNYHINWPTNSWMVYLKGAAGGAKLAFANSGDIAVTSAAFPDRVWTHFAVVRYLGNIYIWVGGVLAAGPISNTVDFNSGLATPLLLPSIGYSGGSGPFVLDETRITKAALYTSDFSTNLPGSYIAGFPEPAFTPRNISLGSGSRMDYKDPYFGSQSLSTAGVLSGVVKNGSVPVKRRVRLYESSTGRFVREIWAGVDGTFVFKGLDKGKKFTITSHDHLTGFNDVIAARATPV